MRNPSGPPSPPPASSASPAPVRKVGFFRGILESFRLARDLKKNAQAYRDQPGFMLRRMDEYADVFLGQTGWLTGNLPLQPKLPEGSPPRRFQYQPGYNIAIQPRSTEAVTFAQLRGLGEYTLVRVIIERVKEAIKAHEWDIVAEDASSGSSHEADIAVVKDFFEKPDKRHSWDEWIGLVMEDVLVIDALSVYVHRTRGGAIWGLEVRDGGTIKVLADERGDEPLPPAPAYQQYLYGIPYANFTSEEILYRPRNRRANHFYGYSPVEQIIITINQGFRREIYNLAQFTDGNIPSAFGQLPADWKPEEIKQWSEYWDAVLTGDPQNRSKVRWMPGGPGVGITKMKDEEVFGLFNKFDEWIARIVAYAFGVSPMAFVQLTNRAVAQEMGDQEAEYGFASMKMFLERFMNEIIDKILVKPHLRFNWITDRGRMQSKRIERNVKYAEAGILTIDEIRAEEGLPPLGLPPGVITQSGFVPFGIPSPSRTLAPGQDQAVPSERPAPGDAPAPTPPASPPFRGDPRAQLSGVERTAIDPRLTGAALTPPGPPYAPMGKAMVKCRDFELGQWERFAITRIEKGGAMGTFEAEFVSPPEANEIRAELAQNTAGIEKAAAIDAVRHIFSSRRKRLPEVRLAPPRAGDAAHMKNDLKTALRSVLEAEALRIAGTKED